MKNESIQAIDDNRKAWDHVCELFADAASLPEWGPFGIGEDLDILGVIKGKTFLDIGCGSGILSVAALLLGAEGAVAVDIDSLAVKMARENGKANGFSEPRYTVLNGNLTDKVTGRFDIVAANIVADAIITLSKDIKSFIKPSGVLIASGIIDLRENDVQKAFFENGLEVAERYELGGWLCFVTKQKE